MKFDWRVKRRREIESHGRHAGAADTDDLSRWLVAWVWDNSKSRIKSGLSWNVRAGWGEGDSPRPRRWM